MLTREEVERIEATLQRNLSDFEIHGGMLRYWASIIDAKTLLREYRTAMDERDALAAEGRRLREALEAIASGLFHPSQLRSIAKTGLLKSPLITAEVARARRLEAVLEAAEALIDARGAHIEGCVPLKNAIAAYREGEK